LRNRRAGVCQHVRKRTAADPPARRARPNPRPNRSSSTSSQRTSPACETQPPQPLPPPLPPRIHLDGYNAVNCRAPCCRPSCAAIRAPAAEPHTAQQSRSPPFKRPPQPATRPRPLLTAPICSSFDFLALNLLGWFAYATFNVGIYFGFGCPRSAPPAPSPAARAAAAAAGYASASGDGVGEASEAGFDGDRYCQTAVDVNDVFFAVHALVLTLVLLCQCLVYPSGGQRVHGAVRAGVLAAAATAGAYAAAVALWGGEGGGLGGGAAPAWLAGRLLWRDWLYFLSYVKMGVSRGCRCLPTSTLNHSMCWQGYELRVLLGQQRRTAWTA
jgi:hypothetical protein